MPSLLSLPSPVLEHILAQLSQLELHSIATVCKQLHALHGTSAVLWSRYNLNLTQEPSGDAVHLAFRWFAARRHLITSLSLRVGHVLWLDPAAFLLSLLGPQLRRLIIETVPSCTVAAGDVGSTRRLLAPLADAVQLRALDVRLQHSTASGELVPMLGPSLHRLTALECLEWNGAYQFVVEPVGIGPLARLTKLLLAPAAISSSGAAAGQLTGLRGLQLYCRGQAAWPADLAFLTRLQLTKLAIVGAWLTALPPELSGMAHMLAELNLAGNPFEDPLDLEGLQTLGALTSLNLTNCSLQQLPPQLPALTSLLSCSLAYNDMSLAPADVCASLAQLTRLTSINLVDVDVGGIDAQDWLLLARACPALALIRTSE